MSQADLAWAMPNPPAHATPFVTNPFIRVIRHVPVKRALIYRAYNYIKKRRRQAYLCETYFGAKMWCNPNDFIDRMVFNFGFWEPNISACISRILKPGDVFVDVGANIGYDTLLGSCLVGDHGAVIAIEISPVVFPLLQRNVKENDCSNIRLLNIGVSDRKGPIPVYTGPSTSLGETTTVGARGFTYIGDVEGAPLDEILTEDERARLKLIKIDIEGAEYAVFHRLLDTLHLFSPAVQILSEISSGSSWELWQAVFSEMRSAGFRVYQLSNDYDDAWYLSWRQVSPPKPLYQCPRHQCDVLFARPSLP